MTEDNSPIAIMLAAAEEAALEELAKQQERQRNGMNPETHCLSCGQRLPKSKKKRPDFHGLRVVPRSK